MLWRGPGWSNFSAGRAGLGRWSMFRTSMSHRSLRPLSLLPLLALLLVLPLGRPSLTLGPVRLTAGQATTTEFRMHTGPSRANGRDYTAHALQLGRFLYAVEVRR